MPTIAWGKSSGADVTLPWQGNCTVENCRVLRAGEPDDDIALAFSEFAPDSDTRLLYHFNEAGGVSVQDSSPYGNHGTLVGPRVGFDTGSAW
ncbi:MAG: hypothetical protein H5T86_14440, partial [Armatimonadetes bacterium]|nr:hypothetical protein [Armatimonadota bacterium]